MKRSLSFLLLALLISSIALISGCSTKSGTASIANISEESLEKDLIRGKTTQAEVMDKFGVPTSRDSRALIRVPGRKEPIEGSSWRYDYYENNEDKRKYIPVVGGLFAGSAESSSRHLYIYFDKNKIMQDYEFEIGQNGSSMGIQQ